MREDGDLSVPVHACAAIASTFTIPVIDDQSPKFWEPRPSLFHRAAGKRVGSVYARLAAGPMRYRAALACGFPPRGSCRRPAPSTDIHGVMTMAR
eukprot:6579742-Heterocapsa_arctica.AAC.1